MKKIVLLATAGVFSAGVAHAMAHADEMELLDANADGSVTLEEIQEVYSEFTEGDFEAADTNEDGGLDLDELGEAMTAGTIPPLK